MGIQRVSSKKDMQQFVQLPKYLYEHDPYWVPPLWHEEKNAYYADSNVMLKDNEHALFILTDDSGHCIGRIIVYIDSSYMTYTGENLGFFGAYECIDDPEAAKLLLDTAEAWLQDHQIEAMRGPINPVAECWGFLYEGYESMPVLMAAYNPRYYHDQMLAQGLSKVKDLLAYEADCTKGYTIPERASRFSRHYLEKHPEITLRPISTKDLYRDAEIIWNITNVSLKDNWGYVPVEKDVMTDMVKRLKLVMDPDAIWFIEEYGRPIGVAFGFPDPNPLIREIDGNIYPTGMIRFALGRSKIKRYRLLGLGVLPEFHGHGFDILLYDALYSALSPKNILLEANYILEDNYHIKNALDKLELEHTKTYRVYEKKL